MSRSVSLEQLIALNDEIAALVRAGVPLDQGLLELGQEMPGMAGEIALRIGRRMQAGEQLERILETEGRIFPPIWRAVVIAGLKSGHLAAALEQISETARLLADTRREIRASLIYPAIVLAIAFGLFVLLVTHFAPVIADTFSDLTSTTNPLLNQLVRLKESVQWWGIGVPVLVGVLFAFWWRRSHYIREPAGGGNHRWMKPNRAFHDGRMAGFAQVLALLVRHRVPFDEALMLAGEASGDRFLMRISLVLAERLRQGEVIAPEEADQLHLPPLLAWLITTGKNQPTLSLSLSHSARRYRERAERQARFRAAYLPLLFTSVVGGGLTMVLAAALFWPISQLLFDLAKPF